MMTNSKAGLLIAAMLSMMMTMEQAIRGAASAATAPDSESLLQKVQTLQATYNSTPTTFIDTPQNLTDLAAAVTEAEALRLPSLSNLSDVIREAKAAAA